MSVWRETKIDGNGANPRALERIRSISVARVLAGDPPSRVAKSLGIGRSSIYKWLQAYKQGGRQALKCTVTQTPQPKLNNGRRQQVRRWIIGRTPLKYGFDCGLWTRGIIAEMIRYHFGVSLSLASIGALLNSLEITPHNPLLCVDGNGDQGIVDWKQKQYPALRKRARQRRAEILFLAQVGAGDAAAISLVNAKGAFWYQFGTLTAAFLVGLLNEMLNGCKGPIVLIVEDSPVWHTKAVTDYVRKTEGRLELFFLPRSAAARRADEPVSLRPAA